MLGAQHNTTMVPLMSLGGGHGFADPTFAGARAISSARTIRSRVGQNAQNSQCRLIASTFSCGRMPRAHVFSAR